MGHVFLSDEWWEAARGIREKYAGEAAPVPYKLRLNQVITAAPFTEAELRFFLDTSSGQLIMEPGELEAPDVTLTTDYDTAKKLLVDQDQAAAMQAFMAGKVKVQGDMTKLMMMQASPPDETAKKVAAEIKEMTEA